MLDTATQQHINRVKDVLGTARRETRSAFETIRKHHPELAEIMTSAEHFAVDLMGDTQHDDAFGALDVLSKEVSELLHEAEAYADERVENWGQI